jgi:RNA polymerase sigma-70 factor (ECF subfamily)
MQLRRRSRVLHLSLNQEAVERETPLLNLLTDPRPNPEQECHSSELADRTAHLIGLLSPSLRQAIELRELEGLAIREIASLLGVPEGTVKARLSRARAKLRHLVCKTVGRRKPAQTGVKTSVTAINGKLSVIRT